MFFAALLRANGRGLLHKRDWGNEAIAAAGSGHQVSMALVAIPQGAPQRRDVHSETDVLYDCIGPDLSDQITFRDELTRVLQERYQDIQCTAAESDRPVVLQQHVLCREQPKRPERKRVSGLAHQGCCNARRMAISTSE
jgi:hypothetical protein